MNNKQKLLTEVALRAAYPERYKPVEALSTKDASSIAKLKSNQVVVRAFHL